jgi:uncharacterized membrane protein
MWTARALPVISMILAICSSVAYAFEGDWRRALYWAAAATLTATITF